MQEAIELPDQIWKEAFGTRSGTVQPTIQLLEFLHHPDLDLSDHQVKVMVVLCLRVLQEYLHLPESITGFSLSPGPKYGVGCDS